MTATLLSINEHVHWELADTPADGVVASFQPGDYPVFTVGDGQRVVVSGHPADRGTFERYARAVGRPGLIDDERFGDVASRLQRLAELRDELQVGAKTFPSPAELEASLAEEGLAMGVLRTVREVADSEWARERDAIVDVPDRGGGRVRIPNSPWHFSEADVGVRGQPAYRGEHNREVLARPLRADRRRARPAGGRRRPLQPAPRLTGAPLPGRPDEGRLRPPPDRRRHVGVRDQVGRLPDRRVHGRRPRAPAEHHAARRQRPLPRAGRAWPKASRRRRPSSTARWS